MYIQDFRSEPTEEFKPELQLTLCREDMLKTCLYLQFLLAHLAFCFRSATWFKVIALSGAQLTPPSISGQSTYLHQPWESAPRASSCNLGLVTPCAPTIIPLWCLSMKRQIPNHLLTFFSLCRLNNLRLSSWCFAWIVLRDAFKSSSMY